MKNIAQNFQNASARRTLKRTEVRAPVDLPKTNTMKTTRTQTLLAAALSPKAEPIKLWLAKVGYERMQEMSDPARALERARATCGQSQRKSLQKSLHMVAAVCDRWHFPDESSPLGAHRAPLQGFCRGLQRDCVLQPRDELPWVKGLDEAAAKGWTVVSMKDDWKTIYPAGEQ